MKCKIFRNTVMTNEMVLVGVYASRAEGRRELEKQPRRKGEVAYWNCLYDAVSDKLLACRK